MELYQGVVLRILCSCSYDGTNFHGFQAQADVRTVQGELENVLTIIHKEPITIYGASRTDAGVHAIEQYFHFDTSLNIRPENMQKALNSLLPPDIYITGCEIVSDDFNCRYQALKKEYHYLVDLGEYNPLYRNYRYFYEYKDKLDINKMISLSKVFIGEHDFKSFTKNKVIDDTVRTIYDISFTLENNLLTVKIIGNGFLHHMVRILVAMLLSGGIGKYSGDDLKRILDAKNRRYAPEIVPACGLYLYKTYY